MLIVCPTCATSYMIDPASLGAAGRTVRCARCKTSWFAGSPPTAVEGFVADVIAEAEERSAPAPAMQSVSAHAGGDDFGAEAPHPAASAAHDSFAPHEQAPTIEHQTIAPGEAPSLVPPLDEAPANIDSGDDIETFAARRARLQARRKNKRRSSKWTAVILVLFGFNVALVGARNEVVRYVPQTASLFAAIGLPVNLRQLSFEGVKINKEEHDGVTVLTVEGNIVSLADKPVEVPRLRLAVRNATGQEIYAWTARASRSILGPREKLEFRSRLASPPADASDVMVRFVTARDAAGGEP